MKFPLRKPRERKPGSRPFIGVYVTPELSERFAALAKSNERSVDAELVAVVEAACEIVEPSAFLVWDGRSFLGGSEPYLYPSRVDAREAAYRALRRAGGIDQQTTLDIVYASFHDVGDNR